MKLILPLSVVLKRKTKADKVWNLNLNIYRNSNFHILNNVKKLYKEKVEQAVQEFFADHDYKDYPMPPFIFVYTIFPANNRAFDISNICSIVDKFTCDALQELGIIKNDNHKIIPEVSYKIGKVDKDNPRVELEIEEYR